MEKLLKNAAVRGMRSLSKRKFSVCGVLLATAIACTYIKIKDYDMLSLTISAVGRAQPLWFFLWGVLTGVTVLLNLFFITERLKIRDSLVYLVIIVCSLSFMLPALYISEKPLSLTIHAAGVFIFGILGYGSLIYCLSDYYRKHKNKAVLVYVFLLLLVLAAAAASFIIYGFNGLTELILLTGAEGVMLCFDLTFRD